MRAIDKLKLRLREQEVPKPTFEPIILGDCAPTPPAVRPEPPTMPILAAPSMYDRLKEAVAAMGMPKPDYLDLDKPELPSDLPPASAEQEAAIADILRHPGNVILTGEAGTGKSTVVRHMALRTDLAICATTGRAALQVGGTTIDKLFCFSRDTWSVRNYAYLAKQMDELPELIVIDEASMIGSSMADLVERLAKQFGKKLLLVGDWAQAAPVKDGWGVTSSLFMRSKFIRLVECHRQSDRVMLGGLNKLRIGVVDEEVRRVFKPCFVSAPPTDDRYIRLFATNNATDSYNRNRLSSITDSSRIFTLQSVHTDRRDRRSSPVPPEVEFKRLEDCRLAHNEEFRIGARVVFTVNHPEGYFVNGDTGSIVEVMLDGVGELDADMKLSEQPYDPWKSTAIEPGTIRALHVKIDRFDGVTEIRRLCQEVRTPLGVLEFDISGFPLRLGWALTIHRAQGMTVDKAYLDMSTILNMQGESKHGLAYVAMSRTRTLEGLQISNWSDQAVYCADAVKPFI